VIKVRKQQSTRRFDQDRGLAVVASACKIIGTIVMVVVTVLRDC